MVAKLMLASTMCMAAGCGGVQEEETANPSEVGEVRAAACSSSQVTTSGFYPQEWLYITSTQTASSGCGHIALQNYVPGSCTMARVRYFPSSGGSYTSAYQNVCGNWVYFSVDVLAGTRFWIESSTQNAQFWVSR